jgi:hypothetical protein
MCAINRGAIDMVKKQRYTRPTSVRVIGSTYKIIPVVGEKWDDCDGYMELGSHTIAVREEERVLAYQQDTVLHETVHAIDETLNLGMTGAQVSQMSSILLAVLKDNPEYTKWLLQDENE